MEGPGVLTWICSAVGEKVELWREQWQYLLQLRFDGFQTARMGDQGSFLLVSCLWENIS